MHYGLIGNNIAHSLSPAIHRFSAQRLGLPHCSYERFQIASCEQLHAFLPQFWQQQGCGLNITAPYKSEVAALLNSPISAVNTLVRGHNYWEAYSTDGEGFSQAVAQLGQPLTEFPSIVILGFGGAVVSLLEYMHSQQRRQLESVLILSRSSQEKCALIAEKWGKSLALRFGGFHSADLSAALAGRGKECLLVQATSAPSKGEDLREFVPALSGFRGTVVDLVYGSPSALFYCAREKGLSCQDGLPMLIEQARVAQQLWWGKTLGYEEIRGYLGKH